MALTQDRDTPRMSTELLSVKVAASTTIYAGAIVMLNSAGFAVPGTTATGLTYVGRAQQTVENSGANGAASIDVRRHQAFKWKNASADAVDQSALLQTCYVVDDETVAKTHGTNTRSAAGIVVALDSDGVWVE